MLAYGHDLCTLPGLMQETRKSNPRFSSSCSVVRFQILTAANMTWRSSGFLAPCGLVEVQRLFIHRPEGGHKDRRNAFKLLPDYKAQRARKQVPVVAVLFVTFVVPFS
jgi:hypothetical protein